MPGCISNKGLEQLHQHWAQNITEIRHETMEDGELEIKWLQMNGKHQSVDCYIKHLHFLAT